MRNYVLCKISIVLKNSYSYIILGGISPTVIMKKQKTFYATAIKIK